MVAPASGAWYRNPSQSTYGVVGCRAIQRIRQRDQEIIAVDDLEGRLDRAAAGGAECAAAKQAGVQTEREGLGGVRLEQPKGNNHGQRNLGESMHRFPPLHGEQLSRQSVVLRFSRICTCAYQIIAADADSRRGPGLLADVVAFGLIDFAASR